MGKYPRASHIEFRWTDLEGKRHGVTTRGFHARLLQHEYDHLDGMLYPMRMIDNSTLGFVSELEPATYPNLPRDVVDYTNRHHYKPALLKVKGTRPSRAS